MSDYPDQVQRLMRDALRLDDGFTKVNLIEEAVRIADTHHDIELAYQVRKELISAALGAGAAEVMIVAYSWCLAQVDRNPQRFRTTDLLWEYRWIVSELPAFPEVPRMQIESMYRDMVRRYQEAGASMRSVYLLRRVVAIDMGDRKSAVAANQGWKRSPHDHYTDSGLTEHAFNIRYLLFIGKTELALQYAEPFFHGNLWSEHHEGATLALLLLPLLRRGRAAEAREYFRRSYRMLSRNPRYISEFADHILFLTLTDNLNRATALLTKHIAAALTNASAINRFYFSRASAFLCERLLTPRRKLMKLRMPTSFPHYCEDGKYSLSELATWFRQDAEKLARQLDHRNETEFYMRELRLMKQFPKWITPCPLKD